MSDDQDISPERIRKLLVEARKRGFNVEGVNLLEGLFEKQLRFVNDTSKRKVGLCGRRAGKTTCVTSDIAQTCLDFPGAKCMYIALTRASAKRLCWSALKNISQKYNLGCEFRETELQCNFPNGSLIWLHGADKADEIEKIRGLKLKKVVLDEAGSYGEHFQTLVDDVLEPALSDLDGTLSIVSTPGLVCAGFFYDITQGDLRDAYSQHAWTMLDNPEFELTRSYRQKGGHDWKDFNRRWLKAYMVRKGWNPSNPTYQREWLGRWVIDATQRVYGSFSVEKNVCDALPDEPEDSWFHVLGIDLGHEDATAFIDASYTRFDPTVYLNRGQKRSGMIVSEIADEIKRRSQTRRYSRMVADCGGLGKMIVAELNTRHGLTVQAAEKREKLSAIELMNSDMHEGRVKCLKGDPWIDEALYLQWGDKSHTYENQRQANHLCDAGLYAYRDCYHYAAQTRPKNMVAGSPEAIKAMCDKLDAAVLDGAMVRGDWWER